MILKPILPLWPLLAITIGLLGILITRCLLAKKDTPANTAKYLVPKIAIILLLFVVGLRPMIIGGDISQVQTNNLDVLFVVDNTISMNAEDYNGNNTRLSAVKADMNYILERLSGAQFSLITFANSATIATPCTRDQNMVKAAISAMEPLIELYARISNLNTSIDSIKTIVKSAEKKDKQRTRIVFFISDGEITDGSALGSYANFKDHFAYGAVFGYGTETGGRMKSRNSYSSGDYLMDYSSESFSGDWRNSNHYAISKIDEKNLKKIASDLGVDYARANSRADIDPVLKKISELVAQNTEPDDSSANTDLYFFIVIPLLALLFFEFNGLWRRKV